MPIMTRKATTQELEHKLSLALIELKASKELCQQLLQEREESEEEVKHIVDKNTELKRELVDLHDQYLDVIGQRDKLQAVTEGFSQCSDLYEGALQRIRVLEKELINANSTILTLNKEKECTQAVATEHLFSELISLNSPPLTGNLITNKYQMSHNKIKKYVRLNKLIQRYNKYKKQQNCSSNIIKLRRERIALISQLNNYQIKLEDSKNIYEIDTHRLQANIDTLEDSLNSLYTKYVSSQKQIEEHILAANKLVDMCSKVDSLTLANIQCTCTCTNKSNESECHPEVMEDMSQSVQSDCSSIPELSIPTFHDSSLASHSSIMFTDSIGKGFGERLANSLSNPFLNKCFPSLSYKQIISSLMSDKYSSNTNLIVFIGNCLGINTEDLTDSVAQMLTLNCNKIILCAFPYIDHLSDMENYYIHVLNNHMQFLVSHYSDKFIFFDINSFVGKLKMTRHAVYLPIPCKRHLATLLAYTFNSVISSMTKIPFATTIMNNYSPHSDNLN